MIESYLHQLSDDWGPTLFYWVHVTLSMCFFLQEISVCYEEYSSLWNVWHPISGKFLRILQRHWDSESGHNQSNCYEKKLWFLAHKKSSFSHRNHFIKSSNPIQKTMECAEKTSRIEWWSWMIQSNLSYDCYDPIQSKLWLLWFLYRLVI